MVLALVVLGCLPALATEMNQITSEIRSSGEGGGIFVDDCNTFFAISSLTAKPITWRNDNVLTKLNASCQRLNRSGTGFDDQKYLTQDYGIEDGDSNQSALCPKELFAVGAIVYRTFDSSYVSGIQLNCASLIEVGKSEMTSVIGVSSDKSETLNCPTSTIVAGLWVRVGSIVDAFGIRCASLKNVEQRELSDVRLSAYEKVFPYSSELRLVSYSGGSGSGNVRISVASNGQEAKGCSYDGERISAESAGNCKITLTKEGDGFYLPKSIEVNFLFKQAISKFIEPTPEPSTSIDIVAPVLPEKKSNEYSPLDDLENVIDLQIAAFALLSIISLGSSARQASGGNSSSKSSDDQKNPDSKEDNTSDERESGDVAAADVTALLFTQGKMGRGDSSRLWRLAHAPKLESKFVKLVEQVSFYSPLSARILLDGTYLRAMFSSLSLTPSLFGIVIAIQLLQSSNLTPYPSSYWLLAAALFLSCMDALAGLVIGGLYLLGCLVTGTITDLDSLMTSIGVFALLVLPALIANAVRPLRRRIVDLTGAWERVTDYFLAALLGGWTVEKIVYSLNGLAGMKLSITDSARDLGICTTFAILARLIFEDIAVYQFPERLAKQASKLVAPNKWHSLYSTLIKASIFFLVSYQFLGLTLQLILGTLILLLPKIIAYLIRNLKLPKSIFLDFLLPSGIFKLIAMVFIGGLFANWTRSLFGNDETYLNWNFVILAIPGLVIALLKLLSRAPDWDWRDGIIGSFSYKVLGIAVAFVIIEMYRGVDIYAWVQANILGF
jgi:hypothetical protein